MAQAHKFRKAKSLFSTTLSAGIGTGTGETITLASVTGLPTDTEITITIDRVNSAGTATPSAMERITGIIAGSNLTAYTRGVDSTSDAAHSSGAVVEYIWSADDLNDIVDGILVGHNQDGTHDFATLYDTNGNEQVKFTPTASAVNELTVTNAATGNAPEISATGGDTNIDLKIRGKGTGVVSAWNPVGATYETVAGESGWISSQDTWTYASASTFTIAGVDRTSTFIKGTKLKLTQTSAKYFYVVSSAFSTNTTVTVTGGTDYTLANAAITSPMYSYVAVPRGFPTWFNYTPTFTGFSADPTNLVHRFKLDGNACTLVIRHGLSGTSNANTFTISLPISAVTLTNALWQGVCMATDNGATLTNPGLLNITSAASGINCHSNYAAGVWTTSNGKRVIAGEITYEI